MLAKRLFNISFQCPRVFDSILQQRYERARQYAQVLIVIKLLVFENLAIRNFDGVVRLDKCSKRKSGRCASFEFDDTREQNRIGVKQLFCRRCLKTIQRACIVSKYDEALWSFDAFVLERYANDRKGSDL